MLEASWKWKLNDKRTQGRYIDKGLVDGTKAQESLNALPDLSSQAVCVEIAMEDCQMDDDLSASETSLDTGHLT